MKAITHALTILAALALATSDAAAARGKNGNTRTKTTYSKSGLTQVYGFSQRVSFAEAFYRHVRLSSGQ